VIVAFVASALIADTISIEFDAGKRFREDAFGTQAHENLGFRVENTGYREQGTGSKKQGSGNRVQGSGNREKQVANYDLRLF